VRLLGGIDYWRYGIEEVARTCRQNKIAFAAVPGDDRADARLAELSTITRVNWRWSSGWLTEGGPANLAELLAWAGDRVGRSQSWCRPQSVPAAGVFDAVKGGMVELETAMARLDPAGPLATIIFYRSLVLASDTAPVTALYRELSARGVAVLPIFVRSLKDAASSAVIAKSLAMRRPDVIFEPDRLFRGNWSGGWQLPRRGRCTPCCKWCWRERATRRGWPLRAASAQPILPCKSSCLKRTDAS
jgi:cobaltochelatase CobN